MKNCKDGKCGIRGGNSTRAQFDKSSRFAIGDIAYTRQPNGEINGQIRYQFIAVKIKSIQTGANGYLFYLLENDPFNHAIPESALFTIEQAELKVSQDKLLHSIVRWS